MMSTLGLKCILGSLGFSQRHSILIPCADDSALMAFLWHMAFLVSAILLRVMTNIHNLNLASRQLNHSLDSTLDTALGKLE